MEKRDWSRMDKLRLGRYAEYLIKMELTYWGFDVYAPEVDDRGIDLIIRTDAGAYYDLQVKSLRWSKTNQYIFIRKDKFTPRRNLLATVALFLEGEEPRLHLIPSEAWLRPSGLLVGHDYEGKESKPEWGINLSEKNLPLLAEFAFDRSVRSL